MIEKSTDEKPHTFAEAVAYLTSDDRPTNIDYEVVVGWHHGALMTRETWLDSVARKSFIDYDGMGNEIDAEGNVLGEVPVVFGLDRSIVQEGKHGWIYPSEASRIRPETKYILWYNR